MKAPSPSPAAHMHSSAFLLDLQRLHRERDKLDFEKAINKAKHWDICESELSLDYIRSSKPTKAT